MSDPIAESSQNPRPWKYGITPPELVALLAFLFGIHLTSRHNYLLFHSTAELFSIVIAATIFLIVINSWRWLTNQYVMFIGVGYGFIAFLDTLHTLAFKGMPIFTDYDYYAPQLWIAARYMESSSMVLAFLFLGANRQVNPRYLLTSFGLVTAWIVAAIFHFKNFPICFVSGEGLTPFKVVSEYIICALLAVSFLLLYRNRAYFDATVYRLLQLSLVMAILMELCFTLYGSDAMSDFFNELGHLLKIATFYAIYKAVVATGLREPIGVLSRELQTSKEKIAAQRLLDTIVDSIPSMIFLKRADDLRFVLFNKAGEKLLGVESKELIGKNDNDLFPKEQADFFTAQDRIALASPTVVDIPEEPIESRVGGHRILHTKKLALRNDEGAIEYLLGISDDITELKLSERERLRSEQRFRSLVETTQDWVWEVDAAGTYTYVNPRVQTLLGYAPEEVIGKTPFDFMPADEAERIRSVFHDLVTGAKDFDRLENINLHKDGHRVVLESSGMAIHDERGRLMGFHGIDRDITERKHAEIEQQRLNRALRLLSEINLLIGQCEDEHTLMNRVCQLVVEVGGYLMGWIGHAEIDAGKTVRPIAQSGYEEGYLESIRVSWDESQAIGLGPTGTAIRTGLSQVNQNVLSNPDMAPWREAALKRGYQASAAIPLVDEITKEVYGALTLYASEADAFTRQEVSLLEELAGNIAFGIRALRTQTERDAAKEATRAKSIFLANMSHEIRTPMNDGMDSPRLFAVSKHQGSTKGWGSRVDERSPP